MKADQQISGEKQLSRTWWNQPLWGEQTFLEKVTGVFWKEQIPESSIFLHNRALKEVEKMSPAIEGLHNEKFGSPEFVLLLQIRSSLLRGSKGYEGLEKSSKILKAAIDTKDSFLKIEEIEFQYRSFAQQQFYEEVFNLLGQKQSKEKFQQQVKTLTDEIVSQLKTEEGKNAIQAYGKELIYLSSEHELALKLLYLFKQSELSDFSILRKTAELINQFKTKEIHNYKTLFVQVKVNYSLFEKLGKIIQLPDKKNNPDSYAKLIQYLALIEKHKKSYIQFKELLCQLEKWETSYEKLKTIRESYPVANYKRPKTFREKVPGLPLYQQYQPWLVITQG